MKKKSLKIKYGSPSFHNKVRYGFFDGMKGWVEFKQKTEEEEGIELYFLMSYEVYDNSELNPFLYEKELDEMGSVIDE